jgi:hypothetical protein
MAAPLQTAVYTDLDGNDFTVEYDPTLPCWMCDEPVGAASMSGTVVCPSCDCGLNRDGSRWTLAETDHAYKRFAANHARAEQEAEQRLLHPPAAGPRSRLSSLAASSGLEAHFDAAEARVVLDPVADAAKLGDEVVEVSALDLDREVLVGDVDPIDAIAEIDGEDARQEL